MSTENTDICDFAFTVYMHVITLDAVLLGVIFPECRGATSRNVSLVTEKVANKALTAFLPPEMLNTNDKTMKRKPLKNNSEYNAAWQ
jgi:hypothetical protein